jgi:hypothetical protein
LFCHFSSHGNWGRYGFWGTKENYADTLSPKYIALQQCVFSQNTAPTSVKNITNINSKIKVYPNPSSGVFTISAEEGEINAVDVYTINGQKVPFLIRKKSNGTEVILNAPEGTYILQLEIDGQFAHKKLLLK